MAHSHSSRFTVRIALQFCTMKRGQEKNGNHINGFSGKRSYSRQFCHFGPKMVRHHNFLDLLSGFFNFAK